MGAGDTSCALGTLLASPPDPKGLNFKLSTSCLSESLEEFEGVPEEAVGNPLGVEAGCLVSSEPRSASICARSSRASLPQNVRLQT